MKTNSRKRLLVSSVAMLLVAMLALGTATYAWFTQNTTATASGIKIHTTKTSTLEIAGNDTNVEGLAWGSTVDYKVDKMLRPASASMSLLTNNSVAGGDLAVEKWYNAIATGVDASAASAGTATEISDIGGHVFKNQLNIRNAGEAPVKDIKVTVSGFNDSSYKYARIALVQANGLGTASVAKSGGSSFLAAQKEASEVFNAATGLTPTTVEGATGNDLTLEAQTITNTPDATTGKLVFSIPGTLGAVTKDDRGNITGYSEVDYNLYVWFEGQDKDCYSSNPVDITNLAFEVSGTTVES